MTMRQQWAIVAGIALVLGGGLFAASHLLGGELYPVSIGSQAPAFRAKELGVDTYKSLADYKGKVVLLNVWATWCPPCQAEMPSIEKLYQRYGAQGLNVVAVSVDDAVSEDSIRAFARDFGLTFQILHDPTGRIEQTYQTTGYPETFVIGKDGVIRKKWIGAADWNDQGNRALVAQLLGIAPERLKLEDPDVQPGFSPADSQRGSTGDGSLDTGATPGRTASLP